MNDDRETADMDTPTDENSTPVFGEAPGDLRIQDETGKIS
jgi:hypothetical protein